MSKKQNGGRQLGYESLEERRMLSAVTVGNNLDVVNGNVGSIANLLSSNGGDGISLREAILAANNSSGPDQIVFDNSLANQTINIQLGNLVINERVTITGPSTGFVFINDASATADTGLTFSGFDNIASL